MRHPFHLACLLVYASCIAAGCGSLSGYPPSQSQKDTTEPPAATPDGPAPTLLSAFFGLDQSMPRAASLQLCRGAGGKDGMPIIFSSEIDPKTLQAGDLRIITASGKSLTVHCVTMAPAIDAGELRTALLLGQLGGADDPPVRVEVVGHVLSADGARTFRGTSIAVTPLAEGPTIVLAESVRDRAAWSVGRTDREPGQGDGCPAGTRQVVRVTWSGGVTRPGGDELGDAERQAYRVRLQQPDSTEIDIVPDAVADLGDNDNNHLLCLKGEGKPLSVSFPAGLLTDPNEDRNPATSAPIE